MSFRERSPATTSPSNFVKTMLCFLAFGAADVLLDLAALFEGVFLIASFFRNVRSSASVDILFLVTLLTLHNDFLSSGICDAKQTHDRVCIGEACNRSCDCDLQLLHTIGCCLDSIGAANVTRDLSCRTGNISRC